MREADLPAFLALLDDVYGLRGQTLTGGQKAMFFRALADYSLREVRAGLDAHVKDPERGRFAPMPADVIAAINALVAADGRPGAEEAWATVVRGLDEAVTIVWTTETAEAWRVAKPVHDSGDEIGARMAFREAYNRLVAEARRQRRPAAWSPSLGHDPRQREAALLEARQLGRLDAAGAALLGVTPAPREPLPLLAAPVGEALPADQQQRARAIAELQRLASTLSQRQAQDTPDALQKRRTADLAAAAQRRVDAYLGDAS